MDCLSYRRIKLAAPQDASHEVVAHVQTCRECTVFTRQLETFEQNLHASLHVAVPEGLAEKIILRRGRPHWFRTAWLPVAAAIVITLTALVTFNDTPSQDRFAREFINHVLSEPEIFTADGNVAPNALTQVFAEFGGRLEANFGDVKYLGHCKIGGVASTHVQVSTSSGDVALLLRPGRQARVETPKVYEGHAVVIVPMSHGSLAIVAATPQQATQFRSLVVSNTDIRS